MSAPRQRSLHFVNISQPAVGDARSAQQQARSHSAREAHARARRLQVEKYQRHSAVQQAEGSRLDCQDVAMEILPKGPFLAMSSNAEDLERGLADIFSPVNQLVSNCKDPFSCSAISLTPTDHFLLDHCECSCSAARGGVKSQAEIPLLITCCRRESRPPGNE